MEQLKPCVCLSYILHSARMIITRGVEKIRSSETWRVSHDQLHLGVVRLNADFFDAAVAGQPRRLVARVLDAERVGAAGRFGLLQAGTERRGRRADRARARHRRQGGVHRLDATRGHGGGAAAGVRPAGRIRHGDAWGSWENNIDES